MTVLAMHMSMRHFFRRSRTHRLHHTGQTQTLARKRMIAIHDHLAVRHIGHGVKHYMLAIVAGALKLHAYLHFFREGVDRLDPHQFRIVFAKRIVRLQHDVEFRTRRLPFQRGFDTRKYAVVTALQIDSGRLR